MTAMSQGTLEGKMAKEHVQYVRAYTLTHVLEGGGSEGASSTSTEHAPLMGTALH